MLKRVWTLSNVKVARALTNVVDWCHWILEYCDRKLQRLWPVCRFPAGNIERKEEGDVWGEIHASYSTSNCIFQVSFWKGHAVVKETRLHLPSYSCARHLHDVFFSAVRLWRRLDNLHGEAPWKRSAQRTKELESLHSTESRHLYILFSFLAPFSFHFPMHSHTLDYNTKDCCWITHGCTNSKERFDRRYWQPQKSSSFDACPY